MPSETIVGCKDFVFDFDLKCRKGVSGIECTGTEDHLSVARFVDTLADLISKYQSQLDIEY